MHLRTLLATVVLLFASGAAHAQDYPGLFFRLTGSGNCQASPGDLILVAVPADFLAGPDNPAARLKDEVEGTGLSRKPYVVRTLPTPRTPEAPGEIQVYVPVEAPGNATLTVTPISGKDKAGKPLVIKVMVAGDAEAPR